jgi:hypothetical protein
MKQLLSLSLFLLPCLAWAQYPSNGNQKITLGEQTTADGLIWRGVANDTNVITPFSDTSAYIILDTVNSKFYHYNRTSTYWSVAGGGTAVTTFSGGTTGLTPNTATSGAVTLGGTLAVANGGTGITSLGTGVATFLGTPSSDNLASAVTNETGSGNLVFATQPVFTNTVGIGGATASTSGSGITFPATQSASTNANTLDDYEEGTWTPVYQGLGGSIGSTAYSLQTGRYTKIGRFCHASGEITLTNKGSWSSGVVIEGLPFTTTATESAFGFIILGFVDLDAGVKYCQFRGTGGGNNRAYIDTILDNAERVILFTTAINNNSTFEFSFIYTVN